MYLADFLRYNQPSNIQTCFLYVIESRFFAKQKLSDNDSCGNIDEIKRDLSIVSTSDTIFSYTGGQNQLMLQWIFPVQFIILYLLLSESPQANKSAGLFNWISFSQKERDIGGRGEGCTQYSNAVRQIGKYRNTGSKIDEMPIPHLWSLMLK